MGSVDPRSRYLLRVDLVDSSPQVRREVSVPATYTLQSLHNVLQVVMGWWNKHLHLFTVGDATYEPADLEATGKASGKVTLHRLGLRVGQQFAYLYDFGDEWEHRIEVVRLFPERDGLVFKVCTDGEGVCPLEDGGGVLRFQELLTAAEDPDHPHHQEATDWVPSDYGQRRFDLSEANRLLALTSAWGARICC